MGAPGGPRGDGRGLCCGRGGPTLFPPARAGTLQEFPPATKTYVWSPKSGRSSAWLERYVRDVEVARSNRVAPTLLPFTKLHHPGDGLIRAAVTGAIASFGTGFDRRAPETRRGALFVVWRVERHAVIVVGRRGGLGGDEVQPAGKEVDRRLTSSIRRAAPSRSVFISSKALASAS
jgi:hypothetical protein